MPPLERMALNLTQFAKKLGIHKMLVSRWERNEVTPNVYNFLSAIKILDISEEEFIETYFRNPKFKQYKES